jgi:hypothetical protein
MGNEHVSSKGISSHAESRPEEQSNMSDQDFQPESGAVREDDIRQSSVTSERQNDKSMEAPEEA